MITPPLPAGRCLALGGYGPGSSTVMCCVSLLHLCVALDSPRVSYGARTAFPPSGKAVHHARSTDDHCGEVWRSSSGASVEACIRRSNLTNSLHAKPLRSNPSSDVDPRGAASPCGGKKSSTASTTFFDDDGGHHVSCHVACPSMRMTSLIVEPWMPKH